MLAAQLQAVTQLLLGGLDRLDLIGVVGGSFLLAFLLLLRLVHLALHTALGVSGAFLHDTQVVTEAEQGLLGLERHGALDLGQRHQDKDGQDDNEEQGQQQRRQPCRHQSGQTGNGRADERDDGHAEEYQAHHGEGRAHTQFDALVLEFEYR